MTAPARLLPVSPAVLLQPLAITALFWFLTANRVTPAQAALALILNLIPWLAFHQWKRRAQSIIPLFALISFANWLAFGVPLFWGHQPADPIWDVPYTPDLVTEILALAVAGTLALWGGMAVRFLLVVPQSLPDLKSGRTVSHYFYLILALGAYLSIRQQGDSALIVGGFRQILEIFRAVIPNAVLAIMLRKYFANQISPEDRLAVFIYLAVRVIAGIASGWLGSFISLGVIAALVYASVHRRLPVSPILVLLPAMLFFQAGKETFRNAYWYGSHSGGITDRISFWISSSADAWSKALQGNSNGSTDKMTGGVVSRLALLDQAGNVLQKTPGRVPYQGGRTYQYLAISLVPRFIWPDKPSVNDANRFYQVAYGMSLPEELEHVSISVGFLVESYINFGWAGVVPVLFIIGIIVGTLERTLLSPEAGMLFNGVGIAMAVNLMAVEGQAAQYLGGIVQPLLLTALVFAPFVQFRKYERTVPGVE